MAGLSDLIVDFLRLKGPSSAIAVARGLRRDSFIISAMLSDSENSGKIKKTARRFGEHKLYYIPEDQRKVEKFLQDTLTPQDKELIQKLLNEQALSEYDLKPHELQIITELEDFLPPLSLKYEHLMFRAWMVPSISVEEAQKITINRLLSEGEAGQVAQSEPTPKPSQKSDTHPKQTQPVAQKTQQTADKTPQTAQKTQQTSQTPQSQTVQSSQGGTAIMQQVQHTVQQVQPQAKQVAPAPQSIPTAPESPPLSQVVKKQEKHDHPKKPERKEEKPETKQHEKPHDEPKKKEQTQKTLDGNKIPTEEFKNEVLEWLEKLEIEVNKQKRVNEKEFLIEAKVPTKIGKQKYTIHIIDHGKKAVGQSEISSIGMDAVAKRSPVMIISATGFAKSAIKYWRKELEDMVTLVSREDLQD